MKLLALNTQDQKGGAAIATYRLHCALRSIGVDSYLLVQRKDSDDISVLGQKSKWQYVLALIRQELECAFPKLYYKRLKTIFSAAWLPENLATKVAANRPDIIHMFWVNYGLLRIETLSKFKQPIVWTLHDMWPFTGGCHYDEGCGRFQQSCGRCPILYSQSDSDLSRRIWARKRKSWSNVPIVVVATSHWLANMARLSSLFKDQRIEVIPNCIDTEKYKPLDKVTSRAAYNLPQDKNLILFSAMSATSEKRKGNQYLVPALLKMSQLGWGKSTELVIVGASTPVNPPDLGMKVHYMGRMNDEISQVLLYSAADVVVAPSLQENLSNTVMESLACGTPVVAFNIGGMPDMIDHQMNGYLARAFDPDDLVEGMAWVLEHKFPKDGLSLCARQTVMERYTFKVVASRYLALYRSLLK